MIEEFERHLRGTNLSENTISSYLFAIRQYSSQYDGITKKNLRAYKVCPCYKHRESDFPYNTPTEAENNEDLFRHRTSHGVGRFDSTSLAWIPKLQNGQHRHPHRLGGHQVLRDILATRSLQAALLLPS